MSQRYLLDTAQVILTTHSPLLLNLVEPEEIRIVKRDDEGATQVSRFTDAPDLSELLDYQGPGEIWVAEPKERIEIFYVTSRREEVRDATARNLVALGLPLPDGSADITKTHLFMAGLTVPGGGAKKYDHYEYVASARKRKPILWLGDNLSDFSAAYGSKVPAAARLAQAQVDKASWGKRWIAFPNPVYGNFLLTLPKIKKPDGTEMTMGDDLRSGEQTDAQVRAPVTADTTPKVGELDLWAYDPDATP